MKQVLIATALLAAFGAAQAVTTVGDTTATTSTNAPVLINVGGSDLDGPTHGPYGAPGIGEGASGTRISLQGIESFTRKTAKDVTVTASGVSKTFTYHQLLGGFQHPNVPGAPTAPTSVDLNGIKVPLDTQKVYFGIASKETATSGTYVHQAWYVGDKDGYVVPTIATSYATVGLLGLQGTSGSSLVTLQGTLNLAVSGGTASTLNGSLSGDGNTLQINTNVNATAGTFSGTSTLSHPTSSNLGGAVSGQFFGSGNNSAVAGIADGGDVYRAAFGGIKQ